MHYLGVFCLIRHQVIELAKIAVCTACGFWLAWLTLAMLTQHPFVRHAQMLLEKSATDKQEQAFHVDIVFFYNSFVIQLVDNPSSIEVGQVFTVSPATASINCTSVQNTTLRMLTSIDRTRV